MLQEDYELAAMRFFFYLTLPPFPNKKRRGPQYCRQLRTCSHRSIKICSSGAQVIDAMSKGREKCHTMVSGEYACTGIMLADPEKIFR